MRPFQGDRPIVRVVMAMYFDTKRCLTSSVASRMLNKSPKSSQSLSDVIYHRKSKSQIPIDYYDRFVRNAMTLLSF